MMMIWISRHLQTRKAGVSEILDPTEPKCNRLNSKQFPTEIFFVQIDSADFRDAYSA